MNVSFLGAGNMTTELGKRFVAKGHKLLVSYSRDRAKLDRTATALGGGTRAGTPKEAAAFGDVIVLATGWDGVSDALSAAGSLEGKVLWSILNPFKPDFSGLRMGTTTSGAEEIAKLAKGACHSPPSWGHPLARVMGPGEGTRRPRREIRRHGFRVEARGGLHQEPDGFTSRSVRVDGVPGRRAWSPEPEAEVGRRRRA
jgi:hypothetical protein